MELLTALAIGLLFAVGVFQMLRRNVIRSVIGLIILGNAVNLFLLSTGVVDGIDPAYTTEAGLRSAALNVLININAIKDQGFAQKMGDKLNGLLEGKPALKDQIYDLVVEKL